MSDAPEDSLVEDAADERLVDTTEDIPLPQSDYTSLRTVPRFIEKDQTVHEFLGGGKVADVLLWRERFLSAGVLAGATLVWIVFHWWQFSLLSVTSTILLVLFVILFVWTNASSLLNRPLPQMPKLELPEDTIQSIAQTLRIELNTTLELLRVVALGKDVKSFFKVSASLWLLSIIGGWFDTLTLLYIGVVSALSLFVIYEKHEDNIDKYAKLFVDEAKKQYRKIDELVISKIYKAQREKVH